jgi:hypothetical protein
MTVASGNFAELLWPGIADLWGHEYNDYKPLYTRVYTTRKSTKRFEKEQGVTGLPLVGVKDEGKAVSYVDPFQGYQKEYVNITYGLGSSVTKEMFEDEMYNYINDIPKMLARSLRQTEETVAWNVLNRAFNSAFTGADGVSLSNASHPLVGGGTYRNTLATAADLTETSLEQAVTDLRNYVDDQSLKIMVMPKMLIVPPALEWTARKILETTQTVGSADNDKNVVRGSISGLVISPYLTDTDAWFLTTDVPKGLTFWNRREASVDRDNEFDTQNLKFLTTRRFSVGWTDARGVFCVPGA